MRGLFAALPGILILMERTCKFEKKSQWHARVAVKLDAIRRAVYYADKPVGLAAAEQSKLEQAFEEQWPAFAADAMMPMVPQRDHPGKTVRSVRVERGERSPSPSALDVTQPAM